VRLSPLFTENVRWQWYCWLEVRSVAKFGLTTGFSHQLAICDRV
jgi:hypothetical protein